MKKVKWILGIGFYFFLFQIAKGQNPLYVPRNVQQAYEKGTRSNDGKPGPNYWQNYGDYSLKISFDPQSRLLTGSETISYSNNSPDILQKVVIHLYPNFYKKGLMRNYAIDLSDENDGVTIDQLLVGNEKIDVNNAAKASLTGTNLTIYPSEKILPDSKTAFTISWHYTVNKGSHVRTGEVDSNSFFLAYTFPRIAVYDDIDGWDEWSYIGLQEFYNDWGNFDAEITVPAGFVVWATGERENAEAVFSKKIYDRYQRALASDDIVHIIDSTDYKTDPVTANTPLVVWKFSAKDVTDFAFALSDHYLWDGSSLVVDKSNGRRVFIDAAYGKESKDFFEVADLGRKCIDIMSTSYPGIPFPFPHETVFNGLDQMEYPMMVNDNTTETHKDLVQLTSHEIMHAYFPFYTGINETKYAWMDEGWATIGESVISPMLGEPEDEGTYMRIAYEFIAGTDKEAPMITNSEIITATTYFTNSYGKPGLYYWTLQDLLGDEIFFKALHEYVNRWHGKHPIPYDFFNTFNDVSGQNLDWFIEPWFIKQGFPDLAIKDVKMEKSKSSSSKSHGEKWTITVERKGNIPVPVALTFEMVNDSSISIHDPASVWKDGKTEYIVTKEIPATLKSIELGNNHIPDVNHKDNVWIAPMNK